VLFLLATTRIAAAPAALPCASCHKEIAATFAQTAMANTWQNRSTSWLPTSFHASISDDLPYQLARTPASFTYSFESPARSKLSLPVDILMGGRRHGLGFLAPIKELDGIPLARPALVQARYAWSFDRKKLLLAPGCSAGRPQNLESALGVVLSPTFEERCLRCHGQSTGVSCQSCHGEGSGHRVVNPKKLSAEDSIGVCAQCHVGLTRFSDPSPSDLLVANQVRAIESSECFIQSGKAFSCTACHDPHKDSTDDSLAVRACLGCHSQSVQKHAAICPVNAVNGCVGCHMPSVEMGPLHLVDHVIRVHPEQKVSANGHRPELQTQVQPISAYLRMIVTNTAAEADQARQRVASGESFYKVAREMSSDRSASIGGYLGRKSVVETMPLHYGEVSLVLPRAGKYAIFQRLPRDFRYDAEQLQSEAEELARQGDAAAAIAKAQEALMIYPQLLRALTFIGMTFAQGGNLRKGADVLTTAVHLYPQDAGAEFARSSVLGALNETAEASEAYKRVIALEPDFTAAYLNLGTIQSSAGDLQSAIATFRQGLQIDPLSADLYEALGQALERAGNASEADQAKRLAIKIGINR